MKSSVYVLAAGLLVAIVSGVVLVVAVREEPVPVVQHGSFKERFQPVPPQTSLEAQRIASIGSVSKLRPVRIEAR